MVYSLPFKLTAHLCIMLLLITRISTPLTDYFSVRGLYWFLAVNAISL